MSNVTLDGLSQWVAVGKGAKIVRERSRGGQHTVSVIGFAKAFEGLLNIRLHYVFHIITSYVNVALGCDGEVFVRQRGVEVIRPP